MKKENSVFRILWEYAVITASCAIYALSFNWFFQPNNIVMGGFTGIAQILSRLIPGLPVGMSVFAMNVPLLILGVRRQGPKLLVGTLFATAVSSLMIDGLDMLYTFPPMEPLLACIYGGVILGVSLGLMLQMSATTGGTELLARLLKYHIKGLSIGRLCLFIDAVVVSLYAITFRNLHYALYGIIAMYISSIAMDTVIYGSINAKMAYIISQKSEEITKKLLAMELGVTLLNGKGAYSGDEKQVIFCAVKRSQITAIKAAVNAIDPAAFIIVCEAHEVLGEGFGEYTPDGL